MFILTVLDVDGRWYAVGRYDSHSRAMEAARRVRLAGGRARVEG